MNISFLANPKFGWFFIWAEIILIYLAFIRFHRVVKRKRIAEEGRPAKKGGNKWK